MGRLGVHQVSVAASQRLSSATSERVCSQCVRQDLDEAQEVIARGDPIVSLSVGAAADFAYGPTRFDFDEDGQPQATEATEGVAPPTTVRLESGDLLVFGGNPHAAGIWVAFFQEWLSGMIVRTGKSRLAYHGVAGCDPERTPSWLHMVPGRLNFTFRNTGLGTEAQMRG